MSSHDAHLAGHTKEPVRIVCVNCGHDWYGDAVSEYGAGWLEPREDCEKCGSTELDATALDAQDIEELRLESRGEDF